MKESVSVRSGRLLQQQSYYQKYYWPRRWAILILLAFERRRGFKEIGAAITIDSFSTTALMALESFECEFATVVKRDMWCWYGRFVDFSSPSRASSDRRLA